MKILVTGSDGFVGKHLCEKLKSLNYDLIETGPSSMHNLKDNAIARFLIRHYKPNIVIHLAARVGGIGANKENPGIFMRDNLTMGINIINASLDYKVEKFIMTGTVCSYPKYTQVPFKEDDIWNGYPEETNAPYGIAKKTLMELIISYNKQFGFNGINLIPVNLTGPEDNFNPEYSHVIPAIILKVYRAIIKGENKVTLWGTGQASREFLYVDDFVNAIILAIQKEPGPQPINIGTGQEIKIYDLVNVICQKMKYNGEIIFDNSKPDGQSRRCLDITRAKVLLEYEPSVDLDTGLNKTIEWFKNNTGKMNDYLNSIQ
jgi:GDP-L-fucose synthase